MFRSSNTQKSFASLNIFSPTPAPFCVRPPSVLHSKTRSHWKCLCPHPVLALLLLMQRWLLDFWGVTLRRSPPTDRTTDSAPLKVSLLAAVSAAAQQKQCWHRDPWHIPKDDREQGRCVCLCVCRSLERGSVWSFKANMLVRTISSSIIHQQETWSRFLFFPACAVGHQCVQIVVPSVWLWSLPGWGLLDNTECHLAPGSCHMSQSDGELH